MSKIADDIRQAMEDALNEHNSSGGFRPIDTSVVLGLSEFKAHTDREIKALIRSGKFRFGGKTNWSDGVDAVVDTSTYLSGRVTKFIIRCMAEGMMIGYNKGSLQGVPSSKWGEAFKEFSKYTDVYALNIALDDDATDIVTDHFADCVKAFDTLLGISDMTGKETAHVWDLWAAALGSGSIAFFLAGQKIGEKWHDEEVLEGILKVTNKGS